MEKMTKKMYNSSWGYMKNKNSSSKETENPSNIGHTLKSIALVLKFQRWIYANNFYKISPTKCIVPDM